MKGNTVGIEVETPDGVVLEGDVHHPASGVSRGVLLLLHAMMVDRRSMDRPSGGGMASVLAQEGWTVLRADFRGRADRQDRPSDWSYDDLVFRDVPTWVSAARTLDPGPLFVIGHSLGGHVTAASLASGVVQVDGLVMVAANIWLPHTEPDPARRWLKRGVVEAFAALGALWGRFPSKRLGIGPRDEGAQYARGLAVPMRSGRWGDRAGTLDWWARWADVSVPVAAWLGEGDRLLAHPVGAVAFAERAGAWVRRVGASDDSSRPAPDHMALVTDPAYAAEWRRMSAWMTQAAASRGG